MKKYLLLPLMMLLVSLVAVAQGKPVTFKVSQKRVSPTEVEIAFTGNIASGWHVYAMNLGGDGPTEASFNVDSKSGVELVGGLKAQGKEIAKFDKLFNMNVRYFENSVTFVQRVKLTAKDYSLKGYLEYGACDDAQCLPPTAVDVKVEGSDGPAGTATAPPTEAALTPAQKAAAAKAKADSIKQAALLMAQQLSTDSAEAARLADSIAAAQATTASTEGVGITDLWTPVVDKLQALSGEGSHSTSNLSLWLIFAMGFGGGLLALFTPCVWPIIPMTVSFFLKRTKNRTKGIRDAIVYGLSIIVIYVGLGLIVTSIWGPSALNDLSTNAVFNILFFLMLVVFGASFLGGFEITLPSKWTQAVDSKAEATTGFLSIFLMAFTLSLVSFSCTGPIIGFLLVEVATTGGMIAPMIGMLGFAVALALPFSLFALFPSLLNKAPKSGGWMNVIKVSLGILELAFALKFLSVADLAYGWGILDREVFLVLWIVLFATLGFYLLGKLRFPHDDEQTTVSVPRYFMGVGVLGFALYMVPGLWGAPLKAVSAFSPPMSTQDFKVVEEAVHPQFKDYDAGMAYAKQVGKPVMVDFTGFGCVNCRKMEASVWQDPAVAEKLNKDYVLISLYVDDKTRLPEPIEVEVGGEKRTLRTIGDKWSYLQSTKFGYNAQPFYVLLDHAGQPLTGSYTYDENVGRYMDFLNAGLAQFKATK